jgi:outer membrane murein-binding lipoprotein Lpp
MAAVALTRHSLANGISDAKSERTTDQQHNHNVRHARLSPTCPQIARAHAAHSEPAPYRQHITLSDRLTVSARHNEYRRDRFRLLQFQLL